MRSSPDRKRAVIRAVEWEERAGEKLFRPLELAQLNESGGCLPPHSPEITNPEKATRAAEPARAGLYEAPALSSSEAGRVRAWEPGVLTSLLFASDGQGKLSRDQLERSHCLIEQRRQEVENESREILENAQQQAREILTQAQQSRDEILQQAQVNAQAALEKGRDDGLAEGRARAGEETIHLLQTAREMVQQVQAWRTEIYAASERQVIDLVKEMARLLFGEGVALEREALKSLYNQILDQAQALGDLKVFTHPEDSNQLDTYWRQIRTSLSGGQIQIIPSWAITRGGCYVEGQLGILDARIETQLSAVTTALDEELARIPKAVLVEEEVEQAV